MSLIFLLFFFKNFYLYNAINADKQLLVAYINATKTSVLSRKPTVKADIVPPNVAIIWLNQHHDICRLNVECSFLITVDTQSNSEKNLKMIISLETVLTSTKKKVKSFTWTLAKVKILVTNSHPTNKEYLISFFFGNSYGLIYWIIFHNLKNIFAICISNTHDSKGVASLSNFHNSFYFNIFIPSHTI